MVVFDTLARCMVGGDEDSSKDMGQFVQAVENVRCAFRCFTSVLHHPTKRGGQERGSGALKGAIHTQMRLERTVKQLTLTCEKQKDAASFDPIALELETFMIGDGVESCVIRESSLTLAHGPNNGVPPRHELRALQALAAMGKALELASWREATGNSDLYGDISSRTFQRIANRLKKAGYVCQRKKRGLYEITEKGTAIANGQPNDGHGTC